MVTRTSLGADLVHLRSKRDRASAHTKSWKQAKTISVPPNVDRASLTELDQRLQPQRGNGAAQASATELAARSIEDGRSAAQRYCLCLFGRSHTAHRCEQHWTDWHRVGFWHTACDLTPRIKQMTRLDLGMVRGCTDRSVRLRRNNLQDRLSHRKGHTKQQ